MKRKLKNLKNMVFQKREKEISIHFTWKEKLIKDYFYHTKASITVVRIMHFIGDYQYVHWTCPELGGGTAGLDTWIEMAKQRVSHDDSKHRL